MVVTFAPPWVRLVLKYWKILMCIYVFGKLRLTKRITINNEINPLQKDSSMKNFSFGIYIECVHFFLWAREEYNIFVTWDVTDTIALQSCICYLMLCFFIVGMQETRRRGNMREVSFSWNTYFPTLILLN